MIKQRKKRKNPGPKNIMKMRSTRSTKNTRNTKNTRMRENTRNTKSTKNTKNTKNMMMTMKMAGMDTESDKAPCLFSSNRKKAPAA